MKKLTLFLLLLNFQPALYSQQLSYRFANPRIIRLSAYDHLQFDVQIKCNTTGYYFWAGQIKLNFNTSAFETNVSNWLFTKSSAFNTTNSKGNPKYSLITTITDAICNIAIIGDVNAEGNGPGSNDFVNTPTDWTTIITVSARLSDPSGDALAGIDFLESGMDGFQQYISAANTFSSFTNPNLYDSRDFISDYTGRYYSTTYGWSQIGGSTDNTQYCDWTTNIKTTVWDGDALIPGGSLSKASVLRIDNPATITIPQTGQLTVSGNTDIETPTGLTLLSDATGTGSLITTTSSGSGTAIVQRWLTGGKWNFISSPLFGQSVSGFISDNTNLAYASNGINRGIMDYNPVTNLWNTYFTTGIGNGNLGAGKGFAVHIGASNSSLRFIGTLQTGAQTTSVIGSDWNCIGNPYTSSIGMNVSASSTDKFLSINATNLDPLYGAIYIWEEPDASNGQSGKYKTYSNASAGLDLQQGQAFIVKIKSGISTISFTPGMQFHNTALVSKSSEIPWPTIKINVTSKEQISSTILTFNHAMTLGLDPTYDAGLLKGSSDLVVSSRFIEDTGIPLAIQALPDNENNLDIPLGLDYTTGGEVVFSSEQTNLTKDNKVILEDKLMSAYTDLSSNTYKANVAPNSTISDRFILHTIKSVAILNPVSTKLNVFTNRNTEISITGKVNKNTIAHLYDAHGRLVLARILKEGNLNTIQLPKLKTGIYLLSLTEKEMTTGFKIFIFE